MLGATRGGILLASLVCCLVEALQSARGPLPALNATCTVTASSGSYQGLIDPDSPSVRQFRKVPFALPPQGGRRWLPPQSISPSSQSVYDSTSYPDSCSQTALPSGIFSDLLPGYFVNGSVSEDCLYLSVWTPVHANKLPVIVFLYGGSFQTGGINTPFLHSQRLVQASPNAVVVLLNYRLNIFGFPNAAGLDQQNLGVLDQRAALEWVRNNIEAFGGDASRIILWGQSAGAVSADYHNFAWHDDPIASGFFLESGSAFVPVMSSDTQQTNFTFVADHFGCTQSSGPARLACMRGVPFEDIQDYIGSYTNNGTMPPLLFAPIPDEDIVFNNYTSRYEQGLVSKQPAIFSTCEDEGNGLVPATRSGVDPAAAEAVTRNVLLCPTVKSSQLRQRIGRPTYRQYYSGNFSSISPLPWMGSYHSSDIPMLFDTYFDSSQGAVTAFQNETSNAMRSVLFDFAKDPAGAAQKHGWPSYESGNMFQFGADGKASQVIAVAGVDEVC